MHLSAIILHTSECEKLSNSRQENEKSVFRSHSTRFCFLPKNKAFEQLSSSNFGIFGFEPVVRKKWKNDRALLTRPEEQQCCVCVCVLTWRKCSLQEFSNTQQALDAVYIGVPSRASLVPLCIAYRVIRVYAQEVLSVVGSVESWVCHMSTPVTFALLFSDVSIYICALHN